MGTPVRRAAGLDGGGVLREGGGLGPRGRGYGGATWTSPLQE